jgi:NADPH2:quinone reductase
MKAVKIKEPGPADQLYLSELKTPEPADGEILIQVHAAGINRPDILQRLGKYNPPEGTTDIPGLEVAGIIAESRSAAFKKGDRVCALLAGGGYAEYVCAPAGQCLPVPGKLDFIEAASLPEACCTVYENLVIRAGLAKGKSVLIHGGSSGIGIMAIQIAAAYGADNIFITAGTEEKCTACIALGAHHAINYKKDDFHSYIREHQPGGLDIVLDMVGGPYIPKNISLLRAEGHHVSIAFLAGAKSEINIAQIMQKRLVLTGSTLRPRSQKYKAELCAKVKEHIWPFIDTEQISPVIDSIYALESVQQAHERMESSQHIGKIILKIRD